MPPEGFVVAMRCRIIMGARPRRMEAAAILVSLVRAGELLAIGLADAAPANGLSAILLPRRTVLGRRVLPRTPMRGTMFSLLAVQPPGLRLVGRWCGSRGFARVCGTTPHLGLVAAGQLEGGATWRLRGWQTAWLGEWSEPDHAPFTLG